MIEEHYQRIGKTINKLRIERKMSRGELADGICSVSYVYRIENGERCPTSIILRQLANKLGVSSEVLMFIIESPFAYDIASLKIDIKNCLERFDLNQILMLVNMNSKLLPYFSDLDSKFINIIYAFSLTMQNEEWDSGMSSLVDLMHGSINDVSTLTDLDFAASTFYGIFEIMKGNVEKCHELLRKLDYVTHDPKYIAQSGMLSKYFVFYTMANIEMNLLTSAEKSVDRGIELCKQKNHIHDLRYLNFLKAEICYKQNKFYEYNLWVSKAMQLHELILGTEDDYFHKFVSHRSSKLQGISNSFITNERAVSC